MPLVSVIIPMRNAEPFVRAAIESVLAQSVDFELEVIVVDDGSTDRSAEIVRGSGDPRVRLIPGPQKGISAAFNAGLAAASGEFLARCDADDLYPPGRIAWQLEFLLDHPEFGAVSGSFATMDSQAKIIEQKQDPHIGDVTDELRVGQGRSHVCAYLFRSQLLHNLGGCREFFVTAEDVDLQLRLSEITRIWHNSRPAYLYRLHDASITHVQRAAERSFYERAARQFQQQRLTRGKDDLDLGQPPSPPQADASAPVSAKRQIQSILLGQAWAAHGAGAKCEAIKLGARAWMVSPFSPAACRSVLALLLKPSKAQLTMRITWVLNHLNLNGGIRVIAIYAERLKKRGHDVVVVTRPRPIASMKNKVKSLVKGEGWPIDPNTLPNHFDGVDVDLRTIETRRPIEDRDVPDADAVIATWWETAPWVNALSPRKGAKAYFVQDFGANDGQPMDKLAATWRYPMHRIVISKYIEDLVKEHAPGGSKMSYVPNSVDLEQFQSPPRGKQPTPVVGTIYSQSSFKGADIAIKACEIARETLPDLKLIGFGQHVPGIDMHWPDWMQFDTFKKDNELKQVYSACDVWLFPPRKEGYGLPVTEAFACRTPVIATPAGAALN